jgi:fructose-1,6-bisphosphatase II
VRYSADGATTASLVMRGRTGTVRTVHAEHRWDKLHAVSEVAY